MGEGASNKTLYGSIKVTSPGPCHVRVYHAHTASRATHRGFSAPRVSMSLSCDALLGIATPPGVAISDSSCKDVVSQLPTLMNTFAEFGLPAVDLSGLALEDITTCDKLCRDVFGLDFVGGGGGTENQGGGGTENQGPDDEDPCESKCPEGKCEGVCESEADINKPECADYVACNSDLGNATEEDDTEEDDVRAPHHHRHAPRLRPPTPAPAPPTPAPGLCTDCRSQGPRARCLHGHLQHGDGLDDRRRLHHLHQRRDHVRPVGVAHLGGREHVQAAARPGAAQLRLRRR